MNPLPGYQIEGFENDAVTIGQVGIAPNWKSLQETRRVKWQPVTIEFVNITVGNQSPMKFFIDLLYKAGYKPSDNHTRFSPGNLAGVDVPVLTSPVIEDGEDNTYANVNTDAADASMSVGSSITIHQASFDAIGMVHIHHLKPNGEYASRYHLQNCIATSINASALSYDDDNINTVSVTLAYQYCDFWWFDQDE